MAFTRFTKSWKYWPAEGARGKRSEDRQSTRAASQCAPFSQQTFWLANAGKVQVWSIMLTIAPLYLCSPEQVNKWARTIPEPWDWLKIWIAAIVFHLSSSCVDKTKCLPWKIARGPAVALAARSVRTPNMQVVHELLMYSARSQDWSVIKRQSFHSDTAYIMNYRLCILNCPVGGVMDKKCSQHWRCNASTNCITLFSFFPLSLAYNCTSAKSPSLYLSRSLSRTHTHKHTARTFIALTAHPHTHIPTHTHTQWVTLPPWGRTVFNCSSALFSVFRRQGIKGVEERERNEEGGERS